MILKTPFRVVGLALLLLGSIAGTATAQEVLVAFDEDESVYEIDAQMAARLGLFGEYEGLVSARLYSLGDGTYELVIERRTAEGQRAREREELAAEEVEALRDRVSQRMVERGGGRPLDQEGRFEMLVTTTIAGGYYGTLLPVAFGMDEGSINGALPLIGTAAGFFVPFYLTQNTEVTEAQSVYTGLGLTAGGIHGTSVALAVGGSDIGSQGWAASTLLFSTVGGVVGYRFAGRRSLTAGVGEAMRTATYLGTGFGLLTSAMIFEDWFDEDVDGDMYVRTLGGLMLAGSIGGAYAGHRWANAVGFSQGDARVWRTAGLVGTLAATTALTLVDAESVAPVSLTLMGGTVGGLFLGDRLVRNREFTEWQGSIITLGTAGGFLFGMGMGVAVDTEVEAALVLSLLGAGGGFGLIYGAYAGDARISSTQSLDIRLRPEGMAAAFGRDYDSPDRLPPPLLTVRWGF